MAVFSPSQLIVEARSRGCKYPDTTLRTFIIGPMCVNSPDHHAVQYGDLERVARGLYRLVGGSHTPPTRRPPGPEALVDAAVDAVIPDHEEEWFWEGNVQAMVVGHLARGVGAGSVGSRTPPRVNMASTLRRTGRASGL